MSNCYVTGETGRLGGVIVKTLKARGDEIVDWGQDFNYMVFAHRYRGDPSFEAEMYANVGKVREAINQASWADGDRSIVVVSSIDAIDPNPHQSMAYNVSKAALNQLVRYYAKTQGVRINSVSPATFTSETPNITMPEVCNVIAFLCSPLSSGINGQDIRVTG